MNGFFSQHAVGLFLAGFGFLIFLGIVNLIRSSGGAKRRKANLREWAFRNGFDYQEGPMPSHELAPLSFFEVNERITRNDATNLVRGSRGTPVTLLDLSRTTYTRTPGNNHSSSYSTETTTCALFKLSEPLPSFSFDVLSASLPDSVAGKLLAATLSLARNVAGAEMADSITIENRPGFLLRTRDGERVRPLFAPDRVAFFDDKCGWKVEAQDSWVLVSCNPVIYDHGWPRAALVDDKRYEEFLTIAQSIAQHFNSAGDHDHFFHSSS